MLIYYDTQKKKIGYSFEDEALTDLEAKFLILLLDNEEKSFEYLSEKLFNQKLNGNTRRLITCTYNSIKKKTSLRIINTNGKSYILESKVYVK